HAAPRTTRKMSPVCTSAHTRPLPCCYHRTESMIGIEVAAATRNHKTNILILVIAAAILILPFANKPFHIDDPYFIDIAQNILKNPLDPFSGAVTLLDQDYQIFRASRTAPNTFETMSHPPLVPYFIALVAKLTGGIHEVPLHLSFFLFPV